MQNPTFSFNQISHATSVKTQFFHHRKSFELESGAVLPELQIAYHTYGELNAKKSNVVWVCHALTANADVADWWKGLVGEGFLINPEEYFIVCANILGSCYGTSSPTTHNIITNETYFMDFPQVTIRDMVKAHDLLRKHLGIEEIALCIGGSMGGQQAMEWAILQPHLFKKLVLLATNAQHSPWGIAFNESQRLAIYADSTWSERRHDAGQAGLSAARSIALLSYRNYQTYESRQSEETNEKIDDFKASSYQRYQGLKLVRRFNVLSYLTLSKAMDSHNVGRGRESKEKALHQIQAKTLVIGITSDILFPPFEQQFLAKHIPDAQYVEIDSPYGHDGFLVETEKISEVLKEFLSESL
ncbi:MAG: homoserine O-acetyltransferase [Thermoflexibacter sp.]